MGLTHETFRSGKLALPIQNHPECLMGVCHEIQAQAGLEDIHDRRPSRRLAKVCEEAGSLSKGTDVEMPPECLGTLGWGGIFTGSKTVESLQGLHGSPSRGPGSRPGGPKRQVQLLLVCRGWVRRETVQFRD